MEAAQQFDLDEALSPWSTFQNTEAISKFEAAQLNEILKKCVKQMVTGGPSLS